MWPNWLPVFGLLAPAPGPIPAHDIYSELRDAYGLSCCDSTDCRPARYRLRGTDVEMLVYGHWVVVPANKIQYRALRGPAAAVHLGGASYSINALIRINAGSFSHPRECVAFRTGAISGKKT